MKFQRDIYYYDKNKLTFVKQSKNLIYILRHYWYFVLISLVSAALITIGIVWLNDTPQNQQLALKNSQISQLVSTYTYQIDSMEEQLASLRQIDEQLYKMILNTENNTQPLDTTLFTSKLKLNPTTQDLESKLHSLEKKLEEQEKKHTQLYELALDNKEKLLAIPSIRPVPTGIISGFGLRKHPLSKRDRMNTGIDFQADVGTAIQATADGTVNIAGIGENSWGLYVVIAHNNGYETIYAHLSKIIIKANQKVKRGDTIGYSGNSGFCKGPHLHYEIHKNKKPVDPIDYFFFDLKPAEYKLFRTKASEYNESMG